MKDIEQKDLPDVSGGFAPDDDCFPPLPFPDYPTNPAVPFPEPLPGPVETGPIAL